MPSKKQFFLGFIVLFIILLAVVFLFWSKNRVQIPQTKFKTWEIILSYNTQSKKLSLKKFKALEETLRPDYRGAQNSPYSIFVKDKNGKELYSTKIHIAEQLVYSIYPNYLQSTDSADVTNLEIDTSIYIPYFESGSKIEIQKNSSLVLEISL